MFKKIFILFFITFIYAYAIDESKIKPIMLDKIQKTTSILQNKSLSKKQKAQKTVKFMDGIFDYALMAKISLGKRWQKVNKKDRSKFIKLFEKKLKRSYFDKLLLYTDQKVIVKNLKKIKSNRITLQSNIIGKDDTYKIIYKFYKQKNRNHWFIYDVDLVGVSIVQTYRKQFKEFLKTKSFKKLLQSL